MDIYGLNQNLMERNMYTQRTQDAQAQIDRINKTNVQNAGLNDQLAEQTRKGFEEVQDGTEEGEGVAKTVEGVAGLRETLGGIAAKNTEKAASTKELIGDPSEALAGRADAVGGATKQGSEEIAARKLISERPEVLTEAGVDPEEAIKSAQAADVESGEVKASEQGSSAVESSEARAPATPAEPAPQPTAEGRSGLGGAEGGSEAVEGVVSDAKAQATATATKAGKGLATRAITGLTGVTEETAGKVIKVAGVAGALATGGLDIAADIKAGGIAGADWEEKASNVGGIVGSGLEVFGAAAGATGIGAPIGAIAELAGFGISAISGLFGVEGAAREAIKQKEEAPPPKTKVSLLKGEVASSAQGTIATSSQSGGRQSVQ